MDRRRLRACNGVSRVSFGGPIALSISRSLSQIVDAMERGCLSRSGMTQLYELVHVCYHVFSSVCYDEVIRQYPSTCRAVVQRVVYHNPPQSRNV